MQQVVSRYVIAAMLVDENKRFLISSFYSSTSNCRLQHCYVSLEIDCKPPIDCIYFYVLFMSVYRHQEFQFSMWYTAHLGTETEHPKSWQSYLCRLYANTDIIWY